MDNIIVIIILGILLVGAIGFGMYSYNTVSDEKAVLQTDVTSCQATYTRDVNLLLQSGNLMYTHLALCYSVTSCFNDWNSCEIKENVNEFTNVCLNTDQNLLKIYDIFRKS